MKRRSFFAALAALPFVGKLAECGDVITLRPGESFTMGWVKAPPGLIEYTGRPPEFVPHAVRSLLCPVGHGYLLVERGTAPNVLIRSSGDEPIRTWNVLTQGDLDRAWQNVTVIPPRFV